MEPIQSSSAQETLGSDRAKAALNDARDASRGLLTDPFGEMAAAYARLGRDRARMVGLVFAGVFALCFAIGMYRLQQSLFGFMMGSSGGGMLMALKMVLAGAAVPATVFGVGVLARKAFRIFDGIELDLFLAGVALLPFSVLMLAIALLSTDERHNITDDQTTALR